jgi:hypothetical protein
VDGIGLPWNDQTRCNAIQDSESRILATAHSPGLTPRAKSQREATCPDMSEMTLKITKVARIAYSMEPFFPSGQV